MGPWLFLAAAIVCEVSATFFLKLSDGFEKMFWGFLSIGFYSVCFWMLAPAMKVIPVGIVYAIWAGVGIVAAGLIGVLGFGEKLGFLQIGFIVMILVGAVGLRLTTTV